jgi:integrase
MRIGEIGALRVADLDLEGGKLYLAKTKTRRGRVVHLRPEFCAELARYVETRPPDGSLWPVTAKSLRFKVNALLREVCEAAGLPHWTSHGFRRSAVTRWIRAGAGLREGSDQFGHSLEVMLRTYQDLAATDARDAAAKAALDALPKGDVVELEEARKRREDKS